MNIGVKPYNFVLERRGDDHGCRVKIAKAWGDAAGEVAAEPVVRRYSLPFLLPTSDSRRQGLCT